ncbi:MAG: DUF11 domain-containing protein [Thermoplasmatales archaeon]|nr:DUF11 domain-containing protein [Thermoplasmatales archaeon]
MDDEYLYLRLCCYAQPNFTIEKDARYKWFIDLNGDGSIQGGNIIGGEYMFFVEDTNNDGIGDVYLLNDTDGDGMFSEWEGNYSGGLITNSSIAGYEIIGNCVLLYLSWDAIGNPYPFYLLAWATDQENPNLEQMPTTDGPDSADIPFGPFFPPYVYLSIEKNDNPDPVYAGGILNYTIWVNNTVGINLTNVTVIETYDSNVTFNSSNPAPTQGNNTWIFNLSVNSSWSVNISVVVNSSLPNGTILHNYVNVTYGNLSNLTGIYNQTWENTTVVSLPINPGISITKEAYPDIIHSGESVTYYLNITNTGDVNLTITSIIDNQSLCFSYSSGDDGDNIFEPGETWIYVNTTSISIDTWNKVNVTAEDSLGKEVYDEASAYVNVINPGIDVEKYVSNDNSTWQESITINSGSIAYWKIVVTNTGDCILYNVWVNDSGNNINVGTLGIGESRTFYWNSSYTEDFTNVVNARGEDELGYEVTDSDTASIDVIEGAPNIYDPKIAEDIDGLPLEPGDVIRYTAWINNTGNASSNDNPGNEFEDEIPACTTYVTGSLEINDIPNDDDISDGIGYDAINNKIIWNGIIPANGSIKISFMVRVNLNATCSIISNQGVVFYDSDGDGINDATQPTDDPSTSEENDPTNLRIDIYPPWSWIVVKEDPAQFVPKMCTVNIYAADDASPWKIFYVIYDGNNSREIREGEWNTTVIFFLFFTEERNFTIEYWAIDASGKEETPHNFASYSVDFTPPSFEIHFSGLYEKSEDRYYIPSTAVISFYAYDTGSGVDRIEYKIDDGSWIKYTSSFRLSEGLHKIYVNVWDKLNNRYFEEFKVQVGGCEPITKCVLDPPLPDGDNGWYKTPVKVELEASDNGSGIAKTFYKIDGKEWIEYNGAFILQDGKHSLFFYSIDKAGFVEEIKKISINIDMFAPEIKIEKPKAWLYIGDHKIIPLVGNKAIVIGKITINIAIEDIKTSGIEATYLYIDGRIVAQGKTEINYTLNEKMYGIHKMKIVSADLAGNIAVKEMYLFILNPKIRFNNP